MAGAEEEGSSKNKQQLPEQSYASLENLPFDSVIKIEILPRLPLKSILRLELASKPLSHIISDHIRCHYRLSTAVSGLFFKLPISLTLSETNTYNFYHALDDKIIDGTLSTLPPYREMEIIDCCNGLLLCKVFGSSQGTIAVVCNPLTGQWVSIPHPVNISHNAVLAFDPRISGHYNILRFYSCKVNVFSSETGKWVRKVVFPSDISKSGRNRQWCRNMPNLCDNYSFFFDGKVYLLSLKYPFVITFDRQGNFVNGIIIPHPEMNYMRRLLGHSCGRLHYAVKSEGKMLVWVEDRDESRWVLKYSVSLQFVHFHHFWVYPVRFHPDMDVIFIGAKDKVFSYHMGSGDLTEVCTNDLFPSLMVLVRPAFVYSPFYAKGFDL